MKRDALQKCKDRVDSISRRIDEIDHRRELIRKAWGTKAVEAQEKATQNYFETEMNTPKGYAWINGRLTKVGPDKYGR